MGVLLSRTPDLKSVSKVTKAYESLRRPCVDGMRDFADANIANFKMTDGIEQMKGATTSVMDIERWVWVNGYWVAEEAWRCVLS